MLWLSGWFYRKSHVINPATGAGTGYQVRVKVHYGAGTDSGEDVYCNSLCRTDFGDIRFTDDSNNLLDYWMQSKTDGADAVFWVEIAGNLESTAQTIYVYYGKNDAATTSNQANTFVDVIPNVAYAAPLEEADSEVSPTVIADDNQTAFWTLGFGAAGSYGFTVSDDLVEKKSGTDSYKITAGAGSYATCWFYHTYPTNQNWSAKNKLRLWMYGTNSGTTFHVEIRAIDVSNKFTASLVDNFSGWKWMDIPFTAFATVGSPSWSTVKYVSVWDIYPAQNGIRFDRLIADVGVPAADYSGNGNNGSATGTTVVASPFFAGKNARQFNGYGDHIACLTSPDFSVWTAVAWFKRLGGSNVAYKGHSMLCGINKQGNNDMYVVDDGTQLVGAYQQADLVFKNSLKSIANPSGLNHVVYTYDGNALKAYVNNSVGSTTVVTAPRSGTNALAIGLLGTNYYGANGIIANVLLFNVAITDTQRANLYANYPDVTLDAGKVLVRKYAATAQPSHDVWGGLERLIVAFDSFSAADMVLRDRLLGVSDSVGVADALLGCKGLLLSDSVGAFDVVAALKGVLVGDAVGLADVFLALKCLDVADSFVLLDWVSVPLRVRSVLDSVCLADGLTVNKALMVAEDVFVVEAAEVGTGDRRTRLFLILGNVAVQLTGHV